MKEIVDALKALADEQRLRIINVLMDNELCVCEIRGSLRISQPLISHHLSILRNAGVLSTKKRGQWVYYFVDKKNIKKIQKLILLSLKEMKNQKPFSDDEERLKKCLIGAISRKCKKNGEARICPNENMKREAKQWK
ncbi:MAG: metalloregulator ArsR/SmtB family transcription factor [Acidobacteriota bacterium]